MDKEIQRMIDYTCDFSKEWLRKNGELMLQFTFLHKNGQMEVCGFPWKDDAEKWQMTQLASALMAATDVVAYIFTSEAWMKVLPEDMSEEEYRKGTKEIEVLVILYVTAGVTQAHFFEMLRGKDGRVSGFNKVKRDAAKITGRMTELLPPAGMVIAFDLKRSAKKMLEKLRLDTDDKR
jgi:hypothetical protein